MVAAACRHAGRVEVRPMLMRRQAPPLISTKPRRPPRPTSSPCEIRQRRPAGAATSLWVSKSHLRRRARLAHGRAIQPSASTDAVRRRSSPSGDPRGGDRARRASPAAASSPLTSSQKSSSVRRGGRDAGCVIVTRLRAHLSASSPAFAKPILPASQVGHVETKIQKSRRRRHQPSAKSRADDRRQPPSWWSNHGNQNCGRRRPESLL